jgi:hypothetical protein
MERIVATTLILICSVALLCPVNAGGQVEFSSSDAFVKSILKGEDRLTEQATGDLNNDGLADWVGVIHREKPAFGSTSQLFVLLQLRQGGYKIAEKSREEQHGGMGCCWIEDLRISRSSIYIQNNAKTAATMEAATHQFKLYRGQWRLVGVRIYYLDHGKDVSTDTDMNLLTGVVIEKRQKGERKSTTKRWTRKFGRHLLKDFDFFNGFGIA